MGMEVDTGKKGTLLHTRSLVSALIRGMRVLAGLIVKSPTYLPTYLSRA